MAREADLYGVSTALISVPLGATVALLMQPAPGEVASTIKYVSGGSLEIHGAPVGTTAPGGSLVTLNGTGYIFGTSEVLSFDGATRYYLMATGATVVCAQIRGLSSGF